MTMMVASTCDGGNVKEGGGRIVAGAPFVVFRVSAHVRPNNDNSDKAEHHARLVLREFEFE